MHEAEKGTSDSASLIIAGKIPMRVPTPASLPAQIIPARRRAPRIPPSPDQDSPLLAENEPMLTLPSSADQASQAQPLESIDGYLLAYYYAALTNLFCQAHLSLVQNPQEDDVVRAAADRSYRDFFALDSWLGSLEQNEIEASPHLPLFLEARESWKNLVKAVP